MQKRYASEHARSGQSFRDRGSRFRVRSGHPSGLRRPSGPLRLLQKNANFVISDLGFPEELGHDLGRFGHLLSIYFARVSLFLSVDLQSL